MTIREHPEHMMADFNLFLDYFRKATAAVGDKYMQLPIDGSPFPIYRERVYCYELYHRLRKQMGENWYYLGGEVDKINHPKMNHPSLKNAKPDLLVHNPGDGSKNLVVIEVKPIKKVIKRGAERTPDIEKDLKTLTAFRNHGGYYKAIYLIYGNDQSKIISIKQKAYNLQMRYKNDCIDLDLIDLYWHRSSGDAVQYEKWM